RADRHAQGLGLLGHPRLRAGPSARRGGPPRRDVLRVLGRPRRARRRRARLARGLDEHDDRVSRDPVLAVARAADGATPAAAEPVLRALTPSGTLPGDPGRKGPPTAPALTARRRQARIASRGTVEAM